MGLSPNVWGGRGCYLCMRVPAPNDIMVEYLPTQLENWHTRFAHAVCLHRRIMRLQVDGNAFSMSPKGPRVGYRGVP